MGDYYHMTKKRRKNPYLDLSQNSESTFELDLTGMMSIMMKLIPLMLTTAVFVKMTVIEAPLPQPIQEAMKEDKREVEIKIEMNKVTGFEIFINHGDLKRQKKIDIEGDKFNFQVLHEYMLQVKREFPDAYHVQFYPHDDVPYSEIVKVMDELRTTKKNEEKIIYKDKKTDQNVETTIMFPGVEFSNVLLEG